jgi:hypothetical protein
LFTKAVSGLLPEDSDEQRSKGRAKAKEEAPRVYDIRYTVLILLRVIDMF